MQLILLGVIIINYARFSCVASFANKSEPKNPIEFPIGTIIMFASDGIPPSGWLLCDGSEAYRLIFKNLFRVIGTKYGAGDGFHTFNLPDFRGRVVVGVDDAEKRIKGAQRVGMSGGQASHQLSKGQLPSHSHGKGTLSVSPSGSHNHSINDPGHDHGGQTGEGWGNNGDLGMKTEGGYGTDKVKHTHTINIGKTGISINPTGDHSHAILGETDAVGNNDKFDLLQPFQTANFIIYVGLLESNAVEAH